MTYPTSFDLEDFSLSSFFSEIAVYLDLQATGKTETLAEEDYDSITHASKILREKSRHFRMQKGDSNEIEFFWELYGKKENESNRNKSRELSADRLAILSEELSIIKDLPPYKVEKLRNICLNLSKHTARHWEIRNPTGFKRYQH